MSELGGLVVAPNPDLVGRRAGKRGQALQGIEFGSVRLNKRRAKPSILMQSAKADESGWIEVETSASGFLALSDL